MGGRDVICNIVWLHGAVSARRRRFSLGYCCEGRGIFKIVPTKSWYPVIVSDVRKVNGRCEFSRSCFLFSCPLNKATYESIANEYKLSVEEAEKLVGNTMKAWEILRQDPDIVEKLQDTCTTGGLLYFKKAPITLKKAGEK